MRVAPLSPPLAAFRGLASARGARRSPLLVLVLLLATALPLGVWPGQAAQAATQPCRFSKTVTSWRLKADCTTKKTIFVPNGVTLYGNDHTITLGGPVTGFAVPSLDNEKVGILARGGTASVVNLKVNGRLSGECSRKRGPFGVVFVDASGRIGNVAVSTVRIGTSQHSCGAGIVVRDTGGPVASVAVTDSTVTKSRVGVIFEEGASGSISYGTFTEQFYGIIATDSPSITIRNNRISRLVDDGIETSSSSATIDGNRITNVTDGIEVSSGLESRVENNGVDGASRKSISVEGRVAVEGNTVTDATLGIDVGGGSVGVRNNTVTGQGKNPVNFSAVSISGVEVNGGGSVVEGNRISNFYSSSPDANPDAGACGILVHSEAVGAVIGANTFPTPPGNEQDVCDERPTAAGGGPD